MAGWKMHLMKMYLESQVPYSRAIVAGFRGKVA